jgi:hypothetical protein
MESHDSDIIMPSHSSGFFSCTMIRLFDLINYINDKKHLPRGISGQNQYMHYKVDPSKDITGDFFAVEDKCVEVPVPASKLSVSPVPGEPQFTDYKKINYAALAPIVRRYFSPSQRIIDLVRVLKDRYAIIPENTCGIMYRGNDKAHETTPPSYSEVIEKAGRIKKANPNIQFFVQTDEAEFLAEFLKKYPKSIYLAETPRLSKQMSSVQLALPKNEVFDGTLHYIAAIHILASCKYLITTSGNGELWIALYRGHAQGVFQYLRENEYIWGSKNAHYNPEKKYFWL